MHATTSDKDECSNDESCNNEAPTTKAPTMNAPTAGLSDDECSDGWALQRKSSELEPPPTPYNDEPLHEIHRKP
jgi:hypothetical protein